MCITGSVGLWRWEEMISVGPAHTLALDGGPVQMFCSKLHHTLTQNTDRLKNKTVTANPLSAILSRNS